MEEHQLVLLAAATLIVFFLLWMVYPFFIFVLPIILAFLYYFLRLPQADTGTAEAFFKGWRFGGHRGSPHSFPENSLSADNLETPLQIPEEDHFQALKEGADLIEFDLAISKDGVAVIMHDDTLDRTTDLTGPVKARTTEELFNANLASKFTRAKDSPAVGAVPKEGVPTLESVVQWSVKNNIRMLFDIKDYSDEMVTIIVQIFEKYDLYERAIVCSFFPWVIYKVKRNAPTILTGYTWRQSFFGYSDLQGEVPRYSGPQQWAAELVDLIYLTLVKTFLPTFCGADLVFANERDICPTYVSAMRSKGLRVAVWTVNDVVQAQWMLNTLNIPILTDYAYNSEKLKNLKNFVDANIA